MRHSAFLDDDSHGQIIRDVLQIIKLKVHFRKLVWILLGESQFNILYRQVVILYYIF